MTGVEGMKTYVAYILKCRDGSYYVGSTSDLELRLAQHHSGYFENCHTHPLRPLELIWSQDFSNAEDMVAAERKLKGWSRAKKEALIDGRFGDLKTLSKKNRSF